jgi:hypothetical protein
MGTLAYRHPHFDGTAVGGPQQGSLAEGSQQVCCALAVQHSGVGSPWGRALVAAVSVSLFMIASDHADGRGSIRMQVFLAACGLPDDCRNEASQQRVATTRRNKASQQSVATKRRNEASQQRVATRPCNEASTAASG